MPSPESYEPSPSEIRKAEKSMTDSQREQTEAREDTFHAGRMAEKESSKGNPEQEKSAEAMKEIVEKEVAFWKKLGVEVKEADVKAKIEALPEVEGFDHFVYVPQGIKMSEVFNKMEENGQPVYSPFSPEKMDAFKKVKPDMRDNQKDSYAIATRFQPEPDADTLGDKAKSAEEWEETGETFMQPMEYLITAMRYQTETDRHLDENTYTICPGSRASDGDVPGLGFFADFGRVRLYDGYPDDRDSRYGVRRVVTSSQK